MRKGAPVSAGDMLGRTGSSGRAELPHLNFQIERNRQAVDPFSGAQPADPPHCDASAPDPARKTLWQATEGLRSYAPTIIHRAGLTTAVPEKRRALYDGYPRVVPVTAPALIGYAVLLGTISGTTIDTAITGPDGRILFRNRRSIDEDRARYFAYAGKRRKTETWMPGVYRVNFLVSGESPAGPFRISRAATIALR